MPRFIFSGFLVSSTNRYVKDNIYFSSCCLGLTPKAKGNWKSYFCLQDNNNLFYSRNLFACDPKDLTLRVSLSSLGSAKWLSTMTQVYISTNTARRLWRLLFPHHNGWIRIQDSFLCLNWPLWTINVFGLIVSDASKSLQGFNWLLLKSLEKSVTLLQKALYFPPSLLSFAGEKQARFWDSDHYF
jgi:hypothetical protein